MSSSFPSDREFKPLSRIVDILSANNKLVFAHISDKLTINWASSGIHEFIIEPREDIQGFQLDDLFWEFIGAESELKQLLTGQRSAFQILRVNRGKPDQSIKYLDFLVVPLNLAKPEEGLLLIIEDVTNTGRLEQELVQDRNELRLTQAKLARSNAILEQLNRLKSLFLSIAAHDLRAPLSAIRGYSDLVLSQLPDDASQENQEHLATIHSLVEQMDRLIGDFLDLDSIERGELSIQPVSCDLNIIVDLVANVISYEANLHKLELRMDLQPDPVLVEADPERVQQILYNLISNAIKFTPPGGQIQVSTCSDTEYGAVQVQDSGMGIPKLEFDHIFDLYYRTEESRRSQVRGRGLGLFIVKSLVDAHQGRIEVSNLDGGGAIFTVYLHATKM